MGLGNIGITESYPEVSKEEMQSKLDVLKERFLTNILTNFSCRILSFNTSLSLFLKYDKLIGFQKIIFSFLFSLFK